MDTYLIKNLELFSCTLEGILNNLKMPINEFYNKLVLDNIVVAVNYNFGNKALKGFERFIKSAVKKKTRYRQVQGSGKCFNSAVEPVIIYKDNPYFIKCFSTTGNTQIPGVLYTDMRDGIQVLHLWVDYLNKQNITDIPITIGTMSSLMKNYKCKVDIDVHTEVIDLCWLHGYLQDIKNNCRKNITDTSIELIKPPYTICISRDTLKSSTLIFKFVSPVAHIKKKIISVFPKINIHMFLSGKINILGRTSHEMVLTIINYLNILFTRFKDKLIVKENAVKDSAKISTCIEEMISAFGGKNSIRNNLNDIINDEFRPA